MLQLLIFHLLSVHIKKHCIVEPLYRGHHGTIEVSDALIRNLPIFQKTNNYCTCVCPDTDMILYLPSGFWFFNENEHFLNNFKYHKSNNDALITRNDIIGTLFTISVITAHDTKNNGQWWPIPITNTNYQLLIWLSVYH